MANGMKINRTLRMIVLSVLLLVVLFSVSAGAESYENYVYDSDGKAAAEPQAYVWDGKITGEDLGAGTLNSPKDVFVYKDEKIYISDTGNNRVIELDGNYNLVRVIDSVNNNGTKEQLNQPNSVFRTEETIYIADTGNARIIKLDDDLNLLNTYGKPDSKLITEDFTYEPIDIAVDSAGRMFIVSKNVNNGIIELAEDGEFVGFVGSVKAKLSIFEMIWRAVASDKQREKMSLSVPTEHACVDIDEQGFIYTTVSAVNEDNYMPEIFVSRINPIGRDVLKRNGFSAPMGDVEVLTDRSYSKQYSVLVDVTVRGSGIYSVLDQRMGRIFTYDSNGELMYVFGALGDNEGQFGMPEAIDTLNRDIFLVVDSRYNWISIFKPTNYGAIVTQAVASYYNRDYDKADELWSEALKYTSKSDLAFNGLGKSYLKKSEYGKAMSYFKSSDDRKNYSDALEGYRSELISENFNLIVAIIALLVVLLILRNILRKRRARKAGK